MNIDNAPKALLTMPAADVPEHLRRFFEPVENPEPNVWVIPTEPFSDTRYECPSCGHWFITDEPVKDRLDADGVTLLQQALQEGNAAALAEIYAEHRVAGSPDLRCRKCEAYVEKDSHFATFPVEVASRCIRIGSSEGGACVACGAPRRRSPGGFESSCTCNAATVPCLVLDPFMGSGTTAQVAIALGRHFTGYEIVADYHDLIAERVRQAGLFA